MSFASVVSTEPETDQAVQELVEAARKALSQPADLAIAFYSPHHAANAAELADTIFERLGAKNVLGVQGESIVGGAGEFEDCPAISLWLANWGGQASVDAFHLDLEQTPDGPTLFGWPDAMFEADPTNSLLLCLGDPYTFPAVDLFLPRVNEDYPKLSVAGGMASSPMGAGSPPLFLNGEVKEQGAVGALIRGAAFKTVVSQGCRPVGRPLVVTKGQDNIIAEFGGRTPLDYLRGLLDEVSTRDKELMQKGLLIGMAISEYRDEFRRGDFLIRSLVGLDPRTGALAVTDRVRRGQTVQFHIRDAQAADEDLKEMLRTATGNGPKPGGGLVFTCNGRGARMFSAPDHDAKVIQTEAGPLALAGFFAAGELGPVGGTNFIHGFTASAVLFG